MAKERLAKLLVSDLSPLRGATRHCLPYAVPEFTLGVALVLYLPTLFPVTSLLINQKHVRIHFLPLLPSNIPDSRTDPALPPSCRQLFASTRCFDFSFLQCSSHSSSLTLLKHHLFQFHHCPLSLHLSSLQAPQPRYQGWALLPEHRSGH